MPQEPSHADLLVAVTAEAPRQGAAAVRLNIAIPGGCAGVHARRTRAADDEIARIKRQPGG